MINRPIFVGQGFAGTTRVTAECTYSPPPNCLDFSPKQGSKNEIAKIFENLRDYNKELSVYQTFLKKVDPKNTFTPKFIKGCITSANDVGTGEKKKCSMFNIENKRQLIVEKSGHNLHHVSKLDESDVKFDDLIRNMKNVVEGIKKIDNLNFVHCNINPATILYDVEKNKCFLTDFNMLVKKNSIFKDSDYGWLFHSTKYQLYYPPELNVIFRISKGVSQQQIKNDGELSFFSHELNDVKQQTELKLKRFLDGKIVDEFIKRMRWRDRSVRINKFVKEYLVLLNNNNKNFKKAAIMLKLQDKIDVYGFGCSLLIVFLERFKTIELGSNKHFFEKFLMLIVKSVDPNPLTRISIGEFAKEYESMLNVSEIKSPVKVTPIDKIWNPILQKFVHIDSHSGRILSNPENKRCQANGKIINPKTNYCVSITGGTMKELLSRE